MRFDGTIQGIEKRRKKLRDLKRNERIEVAKAVQKSTVETKRVAKMLAPVKSGETRDLIEHEMKEDGMVGIVYAGETREEKDKAYAVEFGRGPGPHGSTDPQPYIRRAQAYIAKKHKARVRRAMKKAINRSMGNG